MVENAIDTVMGDNLLSNSLLAFADIGVIKAVFKKKMQNMYHARTRGI
jgi:membrane-associated HD superfamily phosphohydrolase